VTAYKLTVREGPKVRRDRYDDLASALAALERTAGEIARSAHARPLDTKLRRFEPAQQVVARLEVAGPQRLHGGVDVRGDGSTEAFTGRVRRRLVEQRAGESPEAALRRTLT
jgi:hypothetical protein